MKRTGDRRVDVVLLNIAEAGKEHAIGLIKAKSVSLIANQVVDVVECSNFNGGAYIVKCSSNVTVDTLWMVSTATYQGNKKSVEIVCNLQSCTAAGDAFEMAICAGGDIDWKGNGGLNAGTSVVFCNKEYDMVGTSDIIAYVYAAGGINRAGSSTITGNVRAPYIAGSDKIYGVKTITSITPVKIPEVDPTPYYNHALANGQVFNSNQHFSGSASIAIPGGIIWVNGDFKRSGSGDFSGCIIATGDIDISGTGNYYKVNEFPLAWSISGKVDFSGHGNVTGLLFAMGGEFDKTGNGNVTGSIICKGNFRKTGGWDFLAYKKNIPVAPGCSGDIFTILKWREL
jgi:hypothetical protein